MGLREGSFAGLLFFLGVAAGLFFLCFPACNTSSMLAVAVSAVCMQDASAPRQLKTTILLLGYLAHESCRATHSKVADAAETRHIVHLAVCIRGMYCTAQENKLVRLQLSTQAVISLEHVSQKG